MAKYRIIEKADGYFYIQERFMFVYTDTQNIYGDCFKRSSLKEAKDLIDLWNRREGDSKIVKIHEVE